MDAFNLIKREKIFTVVGKRQITEEQYNRTVFFVKFVIYFPVIVILCLCYYIIIKSTIGPVVLFKEHFLGICLSVTVPKILPTRELDRLTRLNYSGCTQSCASSAFIKDNNFSLS